MAKSKTQGQSASLGAAMMGSGGMKAYNTPAGVNVAAVRKSKPSGSRVLESITIECTDNGGYSVRVSHKSKTGDKGEPMIYERPKTHVFENLNSLYDFLDNTLGHADYSKGGSDNDGDEG